MNQNKKAFKDDIEKAERNILVVSWLGIISAIVVIVHSLLSI
tara:strand:+ start:538 stop:663 length:126 start_codon:yes stop_codon:yes gene_type:complete